MLLRRRLFAVLGLAAVLLPCLGAEQTTPHRPRSVPPDTLRAAVPAGETLILALPDTLGGRPVAAYRAVHLPALSHVVDRSFFWRTTRRDAGRHDLLVRTDDAASDTLVLRVAVE